MKRKHIVQYWVGNEDIPEEYAVGMQELKARAEKSAFGYDLIRISDNILISDELPCRQRATIQKDLAILEHAPKNPLAVFVDADCVFGMKILATDKGKPGFGINEFGLLDSFFVDVNNCEDFFSRLRDEFWERGLDRSGRGPVYGFMFKLLRAKRSQVRSIPNAMFEHGALTAHKTIPNISTLLAANNAAQGEA